MKELNSQEGTDKILDVGAIESARSNTAKGGKKVVCCPQKYDYGIVPVRRSGWA